MPIGELQARYGMMPALKIFNDITNIEATYAKIREDTDPIDPFDMVVCSPLELELLASVFPHKFELITPGIRDRWMLKGQQARTAGVKLALNLGANFVVMGSQMTKGNSDRNISAEESRKKRDDRELKSASLRKGRSHAFPICAVLRELCTAPTSNDEAAYVDRRALKAVYDQIYRGGDG